MRVNLKKIKQYSLFVAIVCLFASFLLVIQLLNLKKDTDYLREQLAERDNQIQMEQEVRDIQNNQTEAFIKASGTEMEQYLTGTALLDYKQAMGAEEAEADNADIGEDAYPLDQITNVYSLSARRIGPDSIQSFVIYETNYEIETQDGKVEIYSLLLSMEINWLKTEEGYKVANFESQLLKDTIDDLLENGGEGDS